MKLVFVIFFIITCSDLFAQVIINTNQSAEEVPLYTKITFGLRTNIDFADPFNQDNIKIDAIIFVPSGDSLIVPGFYCKGDKNDSEWEIRFAAREVGEFSGYVRIVNQSSSQKSELFHFSVVESNLDGFLSRTESTTFFQFDSGKKFRGIGTDFGWEAKDFEDQRFTYSYYFEKLAEKKGNFTRSWMAPHNLPLEWKDVDNHRYIDDTLRYNTSGAEKLDEVLDLAKHYGIYLMLALDFHGELKTQPNYWGTGNFWSSNLYNIENGGPCNSPAEFFSNPTAKKLYKDRLRYFIARWGYHTNLGVIEFWNEVDNAMADEDIPPADIISWHGEMSAYLKEIDPYDHIISTSISHRNIEGLFDIDEIDFAQAHIYSQTTNLASTIADLNSKYKKPGVVGEFAYDWTMAPDPFSEMAYNNYFHIGLWRGLFSESPVLPLTWWWEYFIDAGQLVELEKVKAFSDLIIQNSENSISPAVVSGDSRVEKLALKSDSNLFVWLKNQKNFGISDVTINVNSYNLSGDINYIVYDCKNGSFSGIQKLNNAENGSLLTLEYLSAQKEIAIFFTPDDDFSMSEKELKKQNWEIKIFPNPASSNCCLCLNSEKAGELILELITSDGRIIEKQNHRLYHGLNEFTISLNKIRNEICFVRLQTADMITTKKILVY